jgi:hypothetical protein
MRLLRALHYRVRYRPHDPAWIGVHNRAPGWEDRTAKIAHIVPPIGRVIELAVSSGGRTSVAGLEQQLDANLAYEVRDLGQVHRSVGQRDVLQLPVHGSFQPDDRTVVFAGILEFTRDVKSLVDVATAQASLCVASYPCLRDAERIWSPLTKLARFCHGYVNSYNEHEIVSLFENAGFRCIARDFWRSQRVFLFAKTQRSV